MPQPIDGPYLEDILRFHVEGNSLDFKAVEYKKDQFPALLKDILAMANSFTSDDRYIIVGVKIHSDGTRSFNGIIDDPTDSAIFQQLVHENIEPELLIDYLPFFFEGQQLMIFRINGRTNPPYLMKKNYGTLEKGDGFIRKGSHQTRLSRADFDRMYAAKTSSLQLVDDNISVVFEASGQDTLTVSSLDQFELPSQAYQAEIKALIQFKAYGATPQKGELPLRKHYYPDLPYESFALDKIQVDFARADQTYAVEDHNYKFGLHGVQLNFLLYNIGAEYVRDAIVEISIPELAGMEMTTHLRIHPYNAPAFPTAPEPAPGEFQAKQPAIRSEKGHYILHQDLGELKRHIRTKAFRSGIRLFLHPIAAGNTLTITCALYGENLVQPIRKRLSLVIQPAQ